MEKILIALVFMATSAVPAYAFLGKCRFEVGGKTYLNGPCNITVMPDGSFEIGTGETRRSKYFALVDVDSATRAAVGYWNGSVGEDHAHERLGALIRRGACWVNTEARVCAER
jgi:hypothetical protein